MKDSAIALSRAISPLFKYPRQVFYSMLLVSILAFWNRYNLYKQIDSYTPSLIMFCILGVIAPWIAHYIYTNFLSINNTIDELTETNNREWFLKQFQPAFGVNLWSVSISLALAIGAIKTDSILWGYSLSRVTTIGLPYFLLLGLLFSMLGNIGWTYFCIIKLAYKLKHLKIDNEPFDSKNEEFKKLNYAFLRMFGVGIIIYLIAISAGWLALGANVIIIPIIKWWTFPPAIAVVSFFLFIQFFLHQSMQRAKQSRLNRINLLIRKHYNIWEKSLSTEGMTQINNLIFWKEKIEKESDWPFDIITTTSVTATIFLPTLSFIIDLFN